MYSNRSPVWLGLNGSHVQQQTVCVVDYEGFSCTVRYCLRGSLLPGRMDVCGGFSCTITDQAFTWQKEL